MKKLNKKNHATEKLPMSGKVKRGFRFYCSVVIAGALMLGTAMPAFAATGDPLTVVNNLSDFIFGLIRAVGLILLGWGIVQVGLSLQSHDPSQRSEASNWILGRFSAVRSGIAAVKRWSSRVGGILPASALES